MNNFVKKFAEKGLKKAPMKNIIVFESNPDCLDNSRAVFDEMLKRGVNDKYILLWSLNNNNELPEDLKGIKNVMGLNSDDRKYKYRYSYEAKGFVTSNYFPQKRRDEQYYIYVAHGAAFKGIKDRRYSLPEYCKGCDFVAYSQFLGKYDVENLNALPNDVNILPYGYARNDILCQKSQSVKDIFGDGKLICWFPTFRQKTGNENAYSNISIPIIYDRENAEKVNTVAKQNNVTLIVKPHPAQDLSTVKEYNLSNIKFIDNKFLSENNILNYELLGNSDALLSDYSSVIYDYLLCDKPIGLCWEDFEEYSKSEGFRVDVNEITKGMEKIYTCNELCAFIESVSAGKDELKEKRNETKKLVHKYCDFKSSDRITDRILSQVEKIK